MHIEKLEKIKEAKREISEIELTLGNKAENFMLFFLGISLGVVGNLTASIIHQAFVGLDQKYYEYYTWIVALLPLVILYFSQKMISKITKAEKRANLLLKKLNELETEIGVNIQKQFYF